MPRQSLIEKMLRSLPDESLQRLEALQSWWATFPYGDISQRQEAINKFEQEYGPLTEFWKSKALYEWPPEWKEDFGISKELDAPTDIGEQAAQKLCGQLLDNSHYDLLLDETGMVLTPSLRPLCSLLKNRIPQDLLDAVRPIVRKAASQRKVAGGNRGVAAGTGMVERKRRDGSKSNIKGAQELEDLNDEDYARLRSATDGNCGFQADGSLHCVERLQADFPGCQGLRTIPSTCRIQVAHAASMPPKRLSGFGDAGTADSACMAKFTSGAQS